MKTVLKPHVRESGGRWDLVVSLALHAVLLAVFTVGFSLLPAPTALELGRGKGGGQGDFVSVGLAADPGGGAGMYKPPITSRPESAPPEERPPEPVVKQQVPEEVFAQEKAKPKPKPPEPRRPATRKQEPAPPPREGLIPREADPGKGPASAGGGTGGGLGSGRGVSVGSGTGEGTIESWYIRQVEQRVGQNWLQTSLGNLERPVEAVASFVVHPDGQITDITIEQRSGISAVDLAVQRAIQASNPLPRLPYELRGRTVRFRAVFEYPPR
ncbi:MAG: hypothetical protein Kow001_21580 [Acidobacteriota bacterium]